MEKSNSNKNSNDIMNRIDNSNKSILNYSLDN